MPLPPGAPSLGPRERIHGQLQGEGLEESAMLKDKELALLMVLLLVAVILAFGTLILLTVPVVGAGGEGDIEACFQTHRLRVSPQGFPEE